MPRARTLNSLTKQLALRINGTPADASLMRRLTSTEIESRLGEPALFRLRLRAGTPTTRAFSAADKIIEAFAAPDTEVEIAQKTPIRETLIVLGDVTSVKLDAGGGEPGQVLVIIEGRDRAQRLDCAPKTRTYVNMKYSEIAAQLASAAGLSADVDDSGEQHEYVIQSNETDWDFLWRLANGIGFELEARGDRLRFQNRGSGAPVEVSWGSGLVRFQPEVSTAQQIATVTVRGWDPGGKEGITGKATSKLALELRASSRGTRGKGSLADCADRVIVDRPAASETEADALAKSLADGVIRQLVTARGAIDPGAAALSPGSQLTVKGVGERLSGDYYVTRVNHRFSPADGFVTEFDVGDEPGLDPASAFDASAEHRPVPYGAGVVVGLVTNNQDPDKLARVKVKFPWLSEDHESTWARMAAVGAGKERGIRWIPEVDDEVLVAFEHGDLRRPYIVGGLWNGVDVAPPDPSADPEPAEVKRFVSHEGLALVFNDKEGSRSIRLSSGDDLNSIVINQDERVVTISSDGDINISGASGKVTIEGQDLEITSDGRLDISAAQDIKIEAGARLELKGGIETKVEGQRVEVAGVATASLRADLVNIN